jgi:hypothetical protein
MHKERSINFINDTYIQSCSFVGFGGAAMTPSPPVVFNLTFVCPDKQVFESDWLAIPFVMMTCQVDLPQRDNLTRSNYLWYRMMKVLKGISIQDGNPKLVLF